MLFFVFIFHSSLALAGLLCSALILSISFFLITAVNGFVCRLLREEGGESVELRHIS